jgi:hypothetical protein
MERSLNNDLTFGLAKEDEVLEKIKTFFKDDIKNTKEIYNNQFCKWDYEGSTGIKYEVKSRRNTKGKYPTTIIPVHKFINDSDKYICLFNFLDGLTYIEYDKEEFNKFEVKNVITYRAGIIDKPLPHFHIPISKLISIN